MELAAQIAALRKKHGFSQEELGEKLGVSRQAVSKWESGQAVPELEKLKELSRIFGVSLNELLQLEESSPKKTEGAFLFEQPEKNAEKQTESGEGKLKKQRNWIFIFTVSGFILALALITICLQAQIKNLDSRLADVQSSLLGVKSEWSTAISSLRASIEQSLESQSSIVSDYHYDVISLQPISQRVKAKFTVTPKNSTADTTAVLSFTGPDFEPFTQEKQGARTQYQGTGLGMSIVKELIEKMNGTITVESVLGEGSAFTVTLPFEIDKHPSAQAAANGAADETALHGLKVLLAEDNELNMEIAEFFLEDMGAETMQAWNGKEAVEVFRNSAPGEIGVILMDIMMPVMDGLEAVQRIRALDRPDAKTVPIIAMTANAFSEDVERSRKAGMTEHLSKPLNAETLKKAILRNI